MQNVKNDSKIVEKFYEIIEKFWKILQKFLVKYCKNFSEGQRNNKEN